VSASRGKGAPLCARPGCDKILPAPVGRGRPRLYCSPKCRSANTARRGVALLRVEVDYDGEEAGTRPTGRVWLVRMRRGSDEVVVANELGRPSADHLAAQISRLIERR